MKQGVSGYSTNYDMILEYAVEFAPRINDPFAAIEQQRPSRQPAAYGIGALKQYRRDSHMTVQQLADFIGISRTTLWSWMRPLEPVKTIKPSSVALVLRKTGIDIGPRRRRSR